MKAISPARKVFVGGPIEHALRERRFDRELRELLEALITALERGGFTVLSAHRHEDFGRVDMAGRSGEVAERDFGWMLDCDVFVAVLPAHGDELLRTDGTCIELGWASALGRPVVMVRGAERISHLIRGLSCIADVSVLTCDRVRAEPSALVAEVTRILSRERDAARPVSRSRR